MKEEWRWVRSELESGPSAQAGSWSPAPVATGRQWGDERWGSHANQVADAYADVTRGMVQYQSGALTSIERGVQSV